MVPIGSLCQLQNYSQKNHLPNLAAGNNCDTPDLLPINLMKPVLKKERIPRDAIVAVVVASAALVLEPSGPLYARQLAAAAHEATITVLLAIVACPADRFASVSVSSRIVPHAFNVRSYDGSSCPSLRILSAFAMMLDANL
mmetsp:Transcript_12651/g.26923  ORF Transcript_12651/g.26923 Transcript_12651/m.26923 type:complete len:141 (+) Transcript_12651:88-510(+)